MMEKLLSLLEHIVMQSYDLDKEAIKNSKTVVLLAIRLNDLTKVAQEFSKFKEHVIQIMGDLYADRVDNVMD
jgi:CII-binding regulator of phage lambda lysogenization HflD